MTRLAPRSRGRRRLWAAALLTLALLAVSCGGEADGGSQEAQDQAGDAADGEGSGNDGGSEPGATTTSPADDAAPEELEIVDISVAVLPIAGHVPLYAAVEEGFFAEEGFENVELQFAEGGAATLPLAIQGDLDVSHAPISSAVQARSEGLPFVMLPAGTYQTKAQEPDHTATVVRKDSGFSSVADLEGATIGVNTINAVNWLYNRAMLEKAGVDPESVTYQEVPFPNMMDALTNGSVDAIATVQPFLHFSLQNDDLEVLAYDFVEVHPGMLISGLGVSESWLEDHPNATAAFNRAVAGAVEALEADTERGIELISDFTNTDEEIIREIGLPSWVNEVDPALVQKQVDLMIEHGMISEAPSLDEVYWRFDGA